MWQWSAKEFAPRELASQRVNKTLRTELRRTRATRGTTVTGDRVALRSTLSDPYERANGEVTSERRANEQR